MSDATPPKPPPTDREIKQLRQDYGLDAAPNQGGGLAYAGLEFGGIVVVAIVLGLWLDSVFNTKPWILLVLMLIGMGGGMYRLIRRVMRGEAR